ncbi:MAG: FecR family protein [Terriglobales bacterium]
MISPLPALCAPPQGQKAGEVGALRPEATRNEQVLKVKDEVQWNDFLKTLQTGRLRAQLLDGSLLSMGSNSQMRVLQHDAASQQTELELSYGRLRNRVVKLTKPGAKYEVKTPHAVIGVIGTDFYVFVDEFRTVVIVYSGKVVVKQRRKDDRDPKMLVVVEPGHELGAGQMLEVRAPGTTAPPPLAEPESTPPGVQEDSIEQTAIDERKERPPWSPKKKILVIGGITAAILTPLIIVITSDDQGCSLCSSGP